MNKPLLSLLVLAGAACAALAQPPSPPPPPPHGDPAAPHALRGPQVRDHHVPGTDGSFGGSNMPRGTKAQSPTPRIFMQAVRESLGPDAPEHLRASPDQIERLEQIGKQAARELRAEPRRDREGAPVPPKPEQAERAQRRAPRPPQAADAPTPPPPPRAPDAMMMDGDGPDAMTPEQRQARAGAHFAKAWEVLRPEQREAVEARMGKLRDEQFRSNEEDKARRDVRKKLAEKDAKPEPGLRAKGGSMPLSPQRRERLLEIFSRLSPEQQDRVLERLEGLANDGPAASPDAPPRARPGDDPNAPALRGRPGRRESKNPARGGESVDKPVPDMKDVNVPRPESSEDF